MNADIDGNENQFNYQTMSIDPESVRKTVANNGIEIGANDQFYGIQKIVLMKKLGRKWDKILVVTGIVLVAWAKNWEGNVIYAASPYVYSAFNALNLASLVTVILYIIQTVLLPMYAKFSDMIGRTEAITIAIFFYIISGIVQTAALNFNTIIGGQVLYAFGNGGVAVLGHVLIADITSAANRGVFQAFYDFPAIVNIFVAPIVGEAIVTHSTWRWAYAMIPFCIGATAVPLLWGMLRLEKAVKKSGQLSKKNNSQYQSMSFLQKVTFIASEIDAVGSILFIGALCMILLPLVLGPSNWGGWNSPPTVGCLVGGFVCALVFVVYEWKVAKHAVIPVGNWSTSTPIAGVMVCACISTIRATNWTYFPIYLQVTRYASIWESNYINDGYHCTFLLSQLAGGFIMKRYKIYRPVVLAGICFYIFGMGLMIPSRYPTSPIGFVIISQIIAGLGSGFIYVPCLVACQSSVPARDLAIITALQQIGGTIATSIGSAISGAIWNALLPGQLAAHVRGEYDAARILGDITYINSLPKEQHDGASIAYGEVQRILSIVSLCLSVLALCFFFRMKAFGLSDHDQHEDHSVEDINEGVSDTNALRKEQLSLTDGLD
ncbi:major facilitator superfamily domain-containing protein [Mycotypha africana]|uniref:major facilitator superfamily domain-containing protein n=1 Tax=Mycotypha africana TaxID=64632 RepID=UPI0023009284|nr:major facilitator superfamily domain-containing protein [Mycotypha africana]KAI8970267.1 major facilitator superfamily domain-containing protein [Mycotypha africana]